MLCKPFKTIWRLGYFRISHRVFKPLVSLSTAPRSPFPMRGRHRILPLVQHCPLPAWYAPFGDAPPFPQKGEPSRYNRLKRVLRVLRLLRFLICADCRNSHTSLARTFEPMNLILGLRFRFFLATGYWPLATSPQGLATNP